VVPAEQVGEAVRYSYCCDYPIVPHDDRGAPLVNRPVFVILASRYRWPRLYHSQLSALSSQLRPAAEIRSPLLALSSPVGAHILALALDAIIAGY
jgi:hypothetical protein